MSEMAKAARAAMKAKAKKMSSGEPHEKVDASSWSPPEMMNTGAKTGMRPLTKRAYKKGGKVVGYCEGGEAVKHAGRKPRKSGGRTIVSDLINRNAKKANLYRDGGDAHVGGLKRGGRAHKLYGGDVAAKKTATPLPYGGMKKGGKVHRRKRADGGSAYDDPMMGGNAARDYARLNSPRQQDPVYSSANTTQSGIDYSDMNFGNARDLARVRAANAGPQSFQWRGTEYPLDAAAPAPAPAAAPRPTYQRDPLGPTAALTGTSLMRIPPSFQGEMDVRNQMPQETRHPISHGEAEKFQGEMDVLNQRPEETRHPISYGETLAKKFQNWLRGGPPTPRGGGGGRSAREAAHAGFKRGGKVHMDAPADKKLIKKALRQHDEHMHGGKHEDIKLKKGGRTHKQYGGSDGKYGSIDELMRAKGIGPYAPRRETAPRDDDMTNPFTGEPRTGGSAKYSNYDTDAESQAALKNAWLKQSKPEYATSQPVPKSEKRGGRTARASGGSMSAREAAAYDRRINDILLDHPPARGFASSDDRYAPDDYRTSQDKMPRTSPDPDPAAMRDLRRGGYDAMLNVNPQESGYRKGGKIGVSEKGGNYTGGTRPIGGRTARASGGRAKGKTTVNVIIAGGDKGLGMGAQAGQRPVAPPMAPPPMPPMPPMAPPAGGPPDMAPPSMAGGPPPMMRKAGGRVYRSYKDMDAGSGSGLGRLEKMEIQKHARR